MKKHATLTMQFNWYSTSQTSWECMQRGRPASSLDTDNLIIKATSILRAWCLLRLFSPRSSIPNTKGKKDDGSHDCFAVLRWMHFSTNITVHSKKQSLWCSGNCGVYYQQQFASACQLPRLHLSAIQNLPVHFRPVCCARGCSWSLLSNECRPL